MEAQTSYGLADEVRQAQLVVPGAPLVETIDFLAELGFRLDMIMPADNPHVAELSGHGLRVRLDESLTGPAGTIRICRSTEHGERAEDARLPPEGRSAIAPNGLVVEFVDLVDPPLPPIDQTLTISRAVDGEWGPGRAAMAYRDLIPHREGGRFIGSHISIERGGPVPDYVHHHRVRFQMIFCRRGWTKLVYEDQGDPFVLQAGDAVLQPPGIRHQVLEASDGLEVVEIGCPAEHETHRDHDLELPTGQVRADRLFAGQRFVRHVAAQARWSSDPGRGLLVADTGIAEATRGLAGARVLRTPSDGHLAVQAVDGAPQTRWVTHRGEFLFLFVLDGTVRFRSEARDEVILGGGDSVTIPAGLAHRIDQGSADLSLLEVSLPGPLHLTPAAP